VVRGTHQPAAVVVREFGDGEVDAAVVVAAGELAGVEAADELGRADVDGAAEVEGGDEVRGADVEGAADVCGADECVAGAELCDADEAADEGGGFDPAALTPHPDVTKPARLQFERGLGIPLMRELADQVEFRHEGGGTTVRLVLTAHLRS
jgi:hypothetical protein